MKGIVRIGGALAVGIVIILGAFYVNNTQATGVDGRIVVAPAPTRTYIETDDSNKDGMKDWEENLRSKVFETINTPTSTIFEGDGEDYVPPTTFTGKFSEAFFQDYLQGKINGQDFSDPTALVGNAVTAIEKNTASKHHTRLELNITPTTDTTLHIYGNQVAEIIQKYSIDNEPELIILARALETNNPEVLQDLTPIYEVYEKMIVETLLMETPSEMADVHIELLNVYEAVKTDLGAMQMAFSDPLYALARTKAYGEDSQNLFNVLKKIGLELKARNISYTNDEPGSLFYIFDI